MKAACLETTVDVRALARRSTAPAAAVAALLMLASPASASMSLDPFRAPAAANGQTGTLDPFRPDGRQAQAEQAPAPPAAAPAPAPAAPAAQACTADEQCPQGTFCEKDVCVPVRTRTNIAYLYYSEGSFREVLLLYWSKRGSTGYRVLFPALWQFWSPGSSTTVVLNTSYHREGDAWSFGFWPLVYVSNRFGWAAPLLGTFAVSNPKEQTSTGAAAFLYWWRRGPDYKLDITPLFVRSSSARSGFWWLFPLSFGWRDAEGKSTLIIPLGYHRKSKEKETLLSPLGFESRDARGVSGSAAWIYWYGEDKVDETGYEVLFPLLWSFRGPQRHTTVFGPFLHWRRGGSRTSTLFPIIWSSRDDDKDSGWGTVLPLAFWWRGEHGRTAGFASLLGGYLRNDAEQRRSLVLLPAFYFSRDRHRDIDFATPLYVRVKNHVERSDTRSAGLLWYDRTDPEGSSKVLFPLFWRFRGADGATSTAVLPFYAGRSSATDQTTAVGIFPLMAYWRHLSDGWGAGLFPLAFFGRQRDRSHAIIPALLFGHVSDAEGSTTVSPAFYRSRDSRGSAAGIPPLLTFWGNRDGRSYAIQFPLFWRFDDANRGTSTTVTPFLFQQWTPEGWRMALGPLLPIVWAGRSGPRSHQVVFPLYWHFRDDSQQRDSRLVLNYFHRTHGGETTDAFLPLFWYRRGTAPGGRPETSLTVFPFVHVRKSEDSTLVLSPVAAWSRTPERSYGFAGPVAWYEGPKFSARGIPLLWADVLRKDTGVRTRQYGPLFMADGQGAKRRLLLPIWGSYHDDHSDQTWVLPTFYRGRWDDGTSITTMPPLFWWSKTPTSDTKVVLSWYQRTTPSSTSAGLLPLWAYGRNESRSYAVIPPLLSAGRWSKDRAWWFTPPVYYGRSGGESTTVGFPLWWSHTTPDNSWRVAFPLYWHWSSASQDSSTTMLGPAFWYRRGTWRTGGFFPLVWRSHDESSGAGTLGTPLFYWKSGPNQSMFLTWVAGGGRSPISSFWYVLTLASRQTPDTRFDMLAPLWFRHHDKPTDTVTTLIPPLLYYSRSAPDRSLTSAMGLFWRRTDVASATTVALPLFYDVHEYHQQRTTVMLPFFIRHRDDAEKSVTWLSWLWYSRRAPEQSTTIFFPFVWDYKRPTERTTLVLPFYVGVERPTYAAKWVFPSYYHREGRGPEAGTYRRALFPFFETAVKRPGDYMWEVVLGMFGHERIGINSYWKVFFFTIPAETPKRSQTSWYSNPTRTAGSAARSVNLSSW